MQPFSSNGGVPGFGGLAAGGGNHTLYASGDIIATFRWNGPGPAPQNVIVRQTCVAAWQSASYGTPVTGTCDNGLGGPQSSTSSVPDPRGKSSSGTCGVDSSGNPVAVYRVVAGASPLVLKAVTVKANVVGDAASGQLQASVSYTASIVNGNWDGPYYFHKGQYAQGVQSQPTTSPWYNNMAGDSPTGTDTYDGNNIFQLTETTKPFAESSGTIIPVWVWSGPNLPGGAAPPAFSINEMTDAFAEDGTNGGGTDWNVDDGQGNTYIENTQNKDYVLDTKPNTTTVSSFNTASGSVWWALGQPFNLTASANGFGVYPPYDYTVYVGMSATMASSGQ